jgi:dTDP-4-dehydrorhamnose 3,5-epimerase
MECKIEGVVIRELVRFTDQRGWLIELFRRDELDPLLFPAMSYISMTNPGVARGPHEHVDQTDYFCFLGPSTFRLYLWDNRSGSSSYQQSFRVNLGESRPAIVIVPPGVVHAYQNIGAVDGLVFNAPNRLYAGEGKKKAVDEIRHEDDADFPFRLDD